MTGGAIAPEYPPVACPALGSRVLIVERDGPNESLWRARRSGRVAETAGGFCRVVYWQIPLLFGKALICSDWLPYDGPFIKLLPVTRAE